MLSDLDGDTIGRTWATPLKAKVSTEANLAVGWRGWVLSRMQVETLSKVMTGCRRGCYRDECRIGWRKISAGGLVLMSRGMDSIEQADRRRNSVCETSSMMRCKLYASEV